MDSDRRFGRCFAPSAPGQHKLWAALLSPSWQSTKLASLILFNPLSALLAENLSQGHMQLGESCADQNVKDYGSYDHVPRFRCEPHWAKKNVPKQYVFHNPSIRYHSRSIKCSQSRDILEKSSYIHTYVHTYVYTCMHTCIHTSIQA